MGSDNLAMDFASLIESERFVVWFLGINGENMSGSWCCSDLEDRTEDGN